MKRKPAKRKSDPILEEFGKRVRTARIAKKWSLENTEEHGWNSWQHLQQIETGRKNVNLVTIVRLLNLLEIDANQLFDDLISITQDR